MSKYIVIKERMAVIECEVEATSEEEAIEIAQSMKNGFEVDNYVYNCYVASVEDEE